MSDNISWASYLYAISIILVVYYAVVLILYYRNDLLNYFLKSKGGFYSSSIEHKYQSNGKELQRNEHNVSSENEKNSIQDLLSTIQSLIKTGASRNFLKEELLLSLQLQLQHQSSLKDSIFKDSINNYIIEAFENYCSIHLSGDEVSALWK